MPRPARQKDRFVKRSTLLPAGLAFVALAASSLAAQAQPAVPAAKAPAE